MVIVKLMGGLGNQMFQYALGRSLSHRLGVELKLDLSWFTDHPKSATKRDYELAAFKIQASTATKDDLDRLRGTGGGRLVDVVRNLTSLRRRTRIRERRYQFDPSILMLQNDIYLEGFWQSEHYFKDIAGILRKEFVLRQDLDEQGHRLENLIDGCQSVSIHFRRGDYATSQSAKKFHGTCPFDYYHEAVAMIGSRVPAPHFFVFSDEPTWVSENFPLDFPTTFIGGSGRRAAHEDIHLMSKCRHHVMANSTFSWWGAWLQGGTDNTVIAPKRWFAADAMNSADLLPERWIRI